MIGFVRDAVDREPGQRHRDQHDQACRGEPQHRFGPVDFAGAVLDGAHVVSSSDRSLLLMSGFLAASRRMGANCGLMVRVGAWRLLTMGGANLKPETAAHSAS